MFVDPAPKSPTVTEEKADLTTVEPLVEPELEEGELPPTPADGFMGDERLKSIDWLLPDWFTTKSCIPAVVSDSKAELTSILIELHRAASHLRRLPPLRLWRGNQRRTWARCTRQFTSYFHAALRTHSNSTDFLKLCLRLLELPTIILGPTLPTPKPRPEAAASLPFKLRKAESLAFQDRLHEATKVLFSHGISPPSNEVLTRLQALHPPLKQEIPVIETKEEQFSITPDQAKKALFRNCSETWKSLDPFGWSTAAPRQSFQTGRRGLFL